MASAESVTNSCHPTPPPHPPATPPRHPPPHPPPPPRPARLPSNVLWRVPLLARHSRIPLQRPLEARLLEARQGYAANCCAALRAWLLGCSPLLSLVPFFVCHHGRRSESSLGRHRRRRRSRGDSSKAAGHAGPSALHREENGAGGALASNTPLSPTGQRSAAQLKTAAWALAWMEPGAWPSRCRILLAWAARLLPDNWGLLWIAVALGPSWTATAWLRSSRLALVPTPLLILAAT